MLTRKERNEFKQEVASSRELNKRAKINAWHAWIAACSQGRLSKKQLHAKFINDCAAIDQQLADAKNTYDNDIANIAISLEELDDREKAFDARWAAEGR